MENLQNVFEVKKTVRFELKAVSGKDEISFEESERFMKDNLLKYSLQTTTTKEERNEEIRKLLKNSFSFSENIYTDFFDFVKKIEKKTIPLGGIEITSQLLEHLDSQQFHKHKKGTNKTKFIPLHHLKGDFGYSWFFDGMKKKIEELKKFEILIQNHQLWTQSDFMAMESAVRWYKDIETFEKRIDDFLVMLSYMRLPEIDTQEKENWTQEERNTWSNATKKLNGFFENEQQKENAKKLQEAIKENAFVECGMLSMNDKGLNKNPAKIKKMKNWLENIQGEQERLLGEIRALDEERKLLLDGENGKDGLYKLLDKESEQWEKNGTDKCKEFAFYLLKNPKYNQELHEKKQKLKKLREIPHDQRPQEFYDTRTELDRLKIEKGLMQDRKRLFLEKGILSFKCFKNIEDVLKKLKEEKNPSKKAQLLNFQYVWEQKKDRNGNYNFSNLRYLRPSQELENLHQKNIDLIAEKKALAQKYGNNKSLINSLQREIERQGKIDYQGVLLRDEHFFYLAFLEKENRKDLWGKYFSEKSDSSFQAMQYERLTFKALEKLALIENATFETIESVTKEELIKLRSQYVRLKEEQLADYIKAREKNFDRSFEKIEKENLPDGQWEKEVQEKIIRILLEVINKLGYDCFIKKIKDKKFKNLEEFAQFVNSEFYTQKWIGIDKEKLFEAEKNGEIQIFKIHNKDFSKAKRTYKNKKNDLFTEYWLDLLERGNANIRILPEIDLFKKRKESDAENLKIITKRKEEKIEIGKNRFCEDKLYAAFRLIFYPEKNSPTVEEFNEKLKTREAKYFLGLDRGENELLTYCLIDENGKVMNDKKTRKKLLGDWNWDENDFNYAEKLKDFKKTREDLEQLYDKRRILKDFKKLDENSEEFQQIQKEIKKLEDKKNKESVLESDTVKRGICGHILEQINEIMMQYPNTFIVLEDLDISQNDEESGNTNKEENLEKTLGGTAYQVVEDAIISKFKYYQTKNNQFEGVQFVPNIERVRDLREVEDKSKLQRNKFGRIKFASSKEQIGRVLFVDEFLSSQMCPECGFCITEKAEKERAEKFGNPIFFEDMQEKEFSVSQNEEHGMIEFEGKTYEIKHFKYLKEGAKTKFFLKDQKICENILKSRLKAQKDFLIEEGKTGDKFFCPNCGKNTEEKNFVEPLESGDDIAAYNIAKRGLAIFPKEKKSFSACSKWLK